MQKKEYIWFKDKDQKLKNELGRDKVSQNELCIRHSQPHKKAVVK